MSISEKDSTSQLEMSIFDVKIDTPRGDPGELDVGTALRGCLGAALRECGQSRYQIAGQMSELLGGRCGCEVLETEQAAWAALARLEKEKMELARREKELRRMVDGYEK